MGTKKPTAKSAKAQAPVPVMVRAMGPDLFNRFLDICEKYGMLKETEALRADMRHCTCGTRAEGMLGGI